MAKTDQDFGGYDGGLTDDYEDETTPKKRGRKKGSSKKDNNKEESKKESDENDPIINALINGEEIDDELLDEAFGQYTPNIDLSCDTTGMINKLKNSPISDADDKNDDNGEQTAVGFVIKWCNRMMLKDDYNETEMEALELMKDLLHHLGMIE